MRIDVAKQPDHVTLIRWDGDNEQEMDDYLKSVSSASGKTADLVVQDDGSAYITSYFPNKFVNVGDYVLATAATFGGPMVTVYSPAEVNTVFYPYPTFPAIAPDAQAT